MGTLSLFLFSIVFVSLHDLTSTISTLTTNYDQTPCGECYSCHNPCQPVVSAPPVPSGPSPFPPTVPGTNSPPPPMTSPPPPPVLPELNCPTPPMPSPPPPPVLPELNCPTPPMPSPPPPPVLPELNCPPPTSTGGGEGVYYFSPPPPTEPTYFPPLYGGGDAYSPPQNIPYLWPNLTFPYFPFSYFGPPPPGIPNSHSPKPHNHPNFISASLVFFFFPLFIA